LPRILPAQAGEAATVATDRDKGAPDADDDAFRAKLADLEPAPRRQAPSAARIRIRGAFEAITAARGRGVSWQQVAELMTADGVRAADGEPLTAGEVKALYHVEKYARGGTRKRRPGLVPDQDAPRFRRRRKGADRPATSRAGQDAAQAATPAAPRDASAAEADDDDERRRAANLRARLARRRPGLREPDPITLGPGDRRPTKESNGDDDNG
jgi:hypothetical protein